jgi:hypothetical protein
MWIVYILVGFPVLGSGGALLYAVIKGLIEEIEERGFRVLNLIWEISLGLLVIFGMGVLVQAAVALWLYVIAWAIGQALL